MADNVSVTSGTGVTIATDEDGSGFQHQWVKIQIGGDGSFVPITTANGLPVQILSLPAFAVGSAVAITSLPALTAASATVTNLGTFAVQVTSLPNFAIGTSVLATVTNAGTFAVQITSLPAFAVGSSVAVTSLPALTAASATVTNLGTFAVQVTSLPNFAIGTSVLATVTNAGTFAVQVTSLPNFAIGTSVLATVTNAGTFAVQVTSLPAFAVGAITSVSNGTIVSVTNLVPVLISDTAYRFVVGQAAPLSGYFRFTSTYASAQTNAVLAALPGSTTAIHVTDCVFSNAQTHGSLTLWESPSNGAVRVVLERLYFRDYGGAVMNFRTPLVLDTNSALIFSSQTATNHSVTVIGYVR